MYDLISSRQNVLIQSTCKQLRIILQRKKVFTDLNYSITEKFQKNIIG